MLWSSWDCVYALLAGKDSDFLIFFSDVTHYCEHLAPLWGTPILKKVGMLVENFEIDPKGNQSGRGSRIF